MRMFQVGGIHQTMQIMLVSVFRVGVLLGKTWRWPTHAVWLLGAEAS